MTQIFMGLVDIHAARAWIDAYAGRYPGILDMTDLFLELSGAHPFLLDRIGDIMSEVTRFLSPEQSFDAAHSELVRLRLAEHGRLLFATQWRKSQAPPERIAAAAVQAMLARLLVGPLKATDVQRDYFPTLNWLINQAVVAFSSQGYELYSPLFGEFLASTDRQHCPVEDAMISAVELTPDLPIYQRIDQDRGGIASLLPEPQWQDRLARTTAGRCVAAARCFAPASSGGHPPAAAAIGRG